MNPKIKIETNGEYIYISHSDYPDHQIQIKADEEGLVIDHVGKNGIYDISGDLWDDLFGNE
jgi:hypothetical protein